MRLFFLFFLACFAHLVAQDRINQSIVQIKSTKNEYDYESPWSPPMVGRAFGSGFVISGNRILTNAHVVSNASFIEVRSSHSGQWYEAQVKLAGHDCDLALLEVIGEGFFEGKKPLEFGDALARQEDEVTVLGFPVGGKELSVSKGVISRIEIGSYSHSGSTLLMSQIDAPVNPGNSGGPVISDGKVVGVIHQGVSNSQNIGYMIPLPIIMHFLEESERGEYLGFPSGVLKAQPIRNPAMRAYYGLKDGGGLLIYNISKQHHFSDVLEVGDILLSIDGHEIDSSGWVKVQDLDVALPFQYLLMMKHYGERAELGVLRKGELLMLEGTLKPVKKDAQFEFEEFDKAPSYFVTGGLVFQPLILNLLSDSDTMGSKTFFELFYHIYNHREEDGEVVVLSRILDDVVNVGYQHLEHKVVKRANGEKIKSLKHLVEIYERLEEERLVLTLQGGAEIILDLSSIKHRNPFICKRYLIHHDRSEDLR